jgi:3D (Asp-Asp-Asp) domain-containing protein
MDITFHDIEVCDTEGNNISADVRVTFEDDGSFEIIDISDNVYCNTIDVFEPEEEEIYSFLNMIIRSRFTCK